MDEQGSVRIETLRRKLLLALLAVAVACAWLRPLDDLAGAGDADVARMADGIRTRLDQASARAEIAAQNLDSQMDEALGRGELDSQLEERKRRLGINQ